MYYLRKLFCSGVEKYGRGSFNKNNTVEYNQPEIIRRDNVLLWNDEKMDQYVPVEGQGDFFLNIFLFIKIYVYIYKVYISVPNFAHMSTLAQRGFLDYFKQQ